MASSVIDSPIGPLGLVATGDGLAGVRFHARAFPSDGTSAILDDAAEQLEAYFAGELTAFDLPLDLDGNEFQRRAGSRSRRSRTARRSATASRRAGSGSARTTARAVGAANGQNPLPLVLPCHRVIGADGSLTGFGGGLRSSGSCSSTKARCCRSGRPAAIRGVCSTAGRRAMRRLATLLGAAAFVVTLAATAPPAGSFARATGTSVFYLALHKGNCGVWPHRGKAVRVVPCSNPAHNLETYWVGHGGWGHAAATHATKFADARARCLAAFQRQYGHSILSAYGWYGFWPDPGAEQAKYGDRLECSLVRYPGEPAMGRGRHIELANPGRSTRGFADRDGYSADRMVPRLLASFRTPAQSSNPSWLASRPSVVERASWPSYCSSTTHRDRRQDSSRSPTSCALPGTSFTRPTSTTARPSPTSTRASATPSRSASGRSPSAVGSPPTACRTSSSMPASRSG